MQSCIPEMAAPAATEGIYDRVRVDIVHGALRPNQRLVEIELAERLGVSRTPVRETLQRLTLEGLVQRTRGGWVVHEHSRDEIRSIYEVRAALDGYAAFLAADRATARELAALEALYPAGDAALALGPDDAGGAQRALPRRRDRRRRQPAPAAAQPLEPAVLLQPPHRAPATTPRRRASRSRGTAGSSRHSRRTGRADRRVARAGARRLRARDRPDEDQLGEGGRP